MLCDPLHIRLKTLCERQGCVIPGTNDTTWGSLLPSGRGWNKPKVLRVHLCSPTHRTAAPSCCSITSGQSADCLKVRHPLWPVSSLPLKEKTTLQIFEHSFLCPPSLPFCRPNMLLTRYFSKMDKTTLVHYTSVNVFSEVNKTLQMCSERDHCLPGTQFKEVSVIIYLRLHWLFYKPSAPVKPFAQSVHTLP